MFTFIRRYPAVVFVAFVLGAAGDYLVTEALPGTRVPLSERRFIIKETSDDRFTLVLDMVTGCQYLSSVNGGIIPLQTLEGCDKDLAKPQKVKVP